MISTNAFANTLANNFANTTIRPFELFKHDVIEIAHNITDVVFTLPEGREYLTGMLTVYINGTAMEVRFKQLFDILYIPAECARYASTSRVSDKLVHCTTPQQVVDIVAGHKLVVTGHMEYEKAYNGKMIVKRAPIFEFLEEC